MSKKQSRTKYIAHNKDFQLELNREKTAAQQLPLVVRSRRFLLRHHAHDQIQKFLTEHADAIKAEPQLFIITDEYQHLIRHDEETNTSSIKFCWSKRKKVYTILTKEAYYFSYCLFTLEEVNRPGCPAAGIFFRPLDS